MSEEETLEESHQKLEKQVCEILKKGGVPFVVGGGNDESYPNASALLSCYKKVGVVNIDAHFDVRPLLEGGRAHSGSPFRQLLEDERFDGSQFAEFAAQGNQCSNQHAQYLHQKHAQVLWLKDIQPNAQNHFRELLNNLSAKNEAVFVSFDLDSVRGADAPGVSCPGVRGLSAEEALQMCRDAGENPRVKLFDLSEFNPTVESDRTGRLVATMFYYFCLGFAQRKKLNK